MADQLVGGNAELVIGFETSYGVPDTTGYKISFAPTSSGFTDQAINESSVIDGDVSPSEPFLGFKDGQVSLTLPIDSDAFGYILKGLFGAPTTTPDVPAVGINTHVYKRLATVPSMAIEFNQADAVGGLFYLTYGITMNTMEISIGGDGELLATITGVAKDTSSSTTTSFTTAINDVTTGTRFAQFQADITGTSEKLTAFSLSFTNNVDGETYVIDGTGSRYCATAAKFGATGNLTALFQNGDLAQDARDFVDQQFTTTFTNGLAGANLRSLAFNMEKTKLNARYGTEIASPNGLQISYDYQAYNKANTSGTALEVTLINDIASFA